MSGIDEMRKKIFSLIDKIMNARYTKSNNKHASPETMDSHITKSNRVLLFGTFCNM